ncbi:MAG: hypothetical protein WC702_02510 [Patescibacteria group bacterium]|jgi:hypothetical protein
MFNRLAFAVAMAFLFSLLCPAVAGAEDGDPKKIAVVLAVDNYQDTTLPRSLDAGLEQTRQLGLALKASGYEVNLVVSSKANKVDIESLFSNDFAINLEAGDSLFLYISMLAVGGDFDDPYLLPWDVNPSDVMASGVRVDGLMGSIKPGVQVIVVTQTMRQGSLGNVALVGPQSRHWSDQAPNILAVSYLPANTGSEWAGFGQVVAEGLDGLADASGNGEITVAEFQRFVDKRVGEATEDKAHVDVTGNYDPTDVIAMPPVRAVAVLPPAPVVPGKKKGHPNAGWAVIGSGLFFGVASASLYGIGDAYLMEPLEPRDQKAYEAVRASQISTLAVGGVLLATGTGILVFRF